MATIIAKSRHIIIAAASAIIKTNTVVFVLCCTAGGKGQFITAAPLGGPKRLSSAARHTKGGERHTAQHRFALVAQPR